MREFNWILGIEGLEPSRFLKSMNFLIKFFIDNGINM